MVLERPNLNSTSHRWIEFSCTKLGARPKLGAQHQPNVDTSFDCILMNSIPFYMIPFYANPSHSASSAAIFTAEGPRKTVNKSISRFFSLRDRLDLRPCELQAGQEAKAQTKTNAEQRAALNAITVWTRISL